MRKQQKDIIVRVPTRLTAWWWGPGYALARVEPDGSVRAWDSVADCYTSCHGLDDSEVAEARRLASLVRAGTHYTAAGIVLPVQS